MVNMRAVGTSSDTGSFTRASSKDTNLTSYTDIKNGKGPATSLFINEIERPTPTAAQALVRVKAFGLNRMDLLQREGNYPLPPQAPKTLGVEFSGIIEELADQSESGFKKGDAVFGLAYGGAYAEYIAVSTHMLVHKPDELSFEECAGIPEVSSLSTTFFELSY
jgi:NADPH:quinone reductase-like Zn-dependent oxidoreductase